MQVDAQLLIGPAVVALYLKDCLLMLRANEGVLVRGWRGRWRASFGRLDWRLRQREPWLCNPFKPWEPVLRLRWDAAAHAGAAPAPAAPASAPRALQLGPWVVVMWLLLFVALPAAYYGHLGLKAMLLVLAELYAFIVVTLVLVWRRRGALGLGNAQFGVLAFEVLACAPYAPNLVRRLSLLRPVDEDLVSAGRRLLEPAALARMNAACLARIDDELDWTDEGSARALALRVARPAFTAPPEATNEQQ